MNIPLDPLGGLMEAIGTVDAPSDTSIEYLPTTRPQLYRYINLFD
jgi:hypothetical protein